MGNKVASWAGGAVASFAGGWRTTAGVLAFLFLMASAGGASAQTWRDLLQRVRDAQAKDQGAAEAAAPRDAGSPDDAASASDGKSGPPEAAPPGPPLPAPPDSPLPGPAERSGPVVGAPASDTARTRPARPIPARAELCYQELASIGADSSFLESDEFHFKHVFQYIDTPPYYRYVGPASIGIEREPKSAPMYQIHEGRPQVGEGHYALLTPMGSGVVADVEIDIDDRGEFAYLFFETGLPPEPHNGTPITRSRFGTIQGARVATTVGDDVVVFRPSELRFHSHSFYEVERGTTWRMAESDQDRWLGTRRYFRTPDNVDYVPADSDTAVRTISPARETTTRVAGVDRTQRIFCRYGYAPLAATNHDAFLPAIERELESWVENVIRPLQHEPVVEIRLGHVGDFVHRDEHGTVAIRLDSRVVQLRVRRNHLYRDREITFGVQARLYFHGKDFGVVGHYSLGTGVASLGSSAIHVDIADRIEERFERGGFPLDRLRTPGGEVPVRFRCSGGTCVLEAQRWYLERAGRL